ncbi:MAG: NYN domain-containing protein [Actinophytocola sp.]|uniref:NYN domain-containing protein n=1 Tax=Actinophytocola sp. TaxID=1872138 RepID=UPI003C756975
MYARKLAADGHRRAALFVDFENVHRGLCESSPEAGRRFATQPARWVQWMERTLGPLVVDLDDQPRKLLRRICYLEPARSGQFRPYFTRAGFRVVDCPALTTMGKNSADIHMVLDILDTLTHPERYDEFIVLSVDADFTPVLLRLREHDRRTAMLVSGPAAAALQAACDFAIPDSVFLDEALGLAVEDDSAPAPAPIELDELRQQMQRVVLDLVSSAAEPVVMARVAHEVRKAVGMSVDTTSWAGSGSFGKFIAQMTNEHLRVDSRRSPGWLYDPTRHTASAQAALNMSEVVDRVSRLVDAPMLSPETYATLFCVLAEVGDTDGDGDQAEAERRARDRCAELGRPVSRPAVHFVVVGLRHQGIVWPHPGLDAAKLAEAFAENVLALTTNVPMVLSDNERAEIRGWLAPAPRKTLSGH